MSDGVFWIDFFIDWLRAVISLIGVPASPLYYLYGIFVCLLVLVVLAALMYVFSG